MYQGISLCTGILGFELGMAIAGLDRHIDIRQCVEINPYCQQLIKLRLPGVPIWDDLATYTPSDDLEPDRTIIWSGFPCQPVSQAGKQRGDEDKRYLWPHILRLLCQIRPVIWVGENVSGLRTIDAGRLFKSILEDLSRSGYCVEWSCVSASEVGAVHKRERVWLIAYRPDAIADAQGFRWRQISGGNQALSGEDTSFKCGFASPFTTNTESQQRTEWRSPQPNERDNSSAQEAWSNPASISSGAEFAHASSTGLEGRRQGKSTSNGVGSWLNQNAQPIFCGSNDGIPAHLGRYLLRHAELEQWLTAATIPTFTRLTSEETRSLSPEDQREYKQLLGEYHRTKKQYEQWLEALGNAICPHQAAIAWHRVGQILGLQ